MDKNEPVYKITPEILNLVTQIARDLERIDIMREKVLTPKLRRTNRIKSIGSSLQIEANSLSMDQVSDIINGKKVIGPEEEILEVKNASRAYDELLKLNPYNIKDLLLEHKLMMKDLVKDAGHFRSGNIRVGSETYTAHIAPLADYVPNLVSELFDWAKSTNLNQILKSCIFHYEFEYIHPFSDGNGRTGRAWQTLLLCQENPVFAWLPIETIIASRQEEYYEAFKLATAKNDSAIFARFMLQAIADTVKEFRERNGEVGETLILEESPLSANVLSVLNAIKKNPTATYEEISTETNLALRTVQRAIDVLKDRGIISRIGTNRVGEWKIRSKDN